MSLRDIASPKKKPPRPRYTRMLTAREVRAMKKRGYDAEREVVHMFRDEGYYAIRIPVSAPSREPLPDVFAIKGKTLLAIEVKSQVRYAYYKRDQVSKLHEFLQMFSLYPRPYAVLAAKFKYKGWWFGLAEKLDDYTLKINDGLRWKELLAKIEP
ncbi:MAG: Holliday junction resolvase Hjc [Candidatus Bathyarchaeota archaeon]|nr:Holliday junction resolvase Hjc [Candidatus Bathyarchaeota archaeon]